MHRIFFAGVALLALSPSARAQTRFPFSMPWDDASHNALDDSDLNPAPIAETGRLRVQNGHFVDGSGRRVRLVGTGLGADANFAAPEDSAKFAARLHKFGFNIVRLHHLDAPWAKVNIFGTNRDGYAASNARVDPTNLDLLDHTVANLKRNGLYVDLNLHVSRPPSPADGFPDADKLPEMGKAVAYFEPHFIAMQKDYARQLLSHTNPDPGQKWADDPAVALVEINNEDSLVAQAWTGALQKLPSSYRATLARGWNIFLRGRYASTLAIRTAWNAPRDEGTPDALNLLANGRFDNGNAGWELEEQENAKGAASLVDIQNSPSDAPKGKVLRIAVDSQPDEGWKLQLNHAGLNLAPNTFYTLRFWARADAARVAGAYFSLDQAPWSHISSDFDLALAPTWKPFRISFKTGQTVPNHGRLSITLGNDKSAVELAGFSLSQGSQTSIGQGETLEAGSLDLPPVQGASQTQGRDWIEYLSALEGAYVATMRDTIKRECGFRGQVTCSQISYGGFAGVARETASDWTDAHAYWQHPEFPHAQWDSKDWRIANTPMLDDADGGTLAALATHRVEGKPFTVSEYNHPAPSDYASETLPTIFAYAGAQDWDGVFLFDYHSEGGDWDSNKIRGFFDIDSDPNKMVFASAMARAFRSGALSPAPAKTTLVVPRGSLLALAAQIPSGEEWRFDENVPDVWRASGLSTAEVLGSRLALRLVDGGGAPRLERSGLLPRVGSAAFDWKFFGTHGRLAVNSSSVKALVGRVAGRNSASWPIGALSVGTPRSSNGWMSLVAVARDGKPLEASGSILLCALNRAENQNAQWNAERTSVGDGWGDGPTLMETPSATLQLRTRAQPAKVWKLDATGKRAGVLPSTLSDGQLSFSIAPSDATPFYEIALSPNDGPSLALKKAAPKARAATVGTKNGAN